MPMTARQQNGLGGRFPYWQSTSVAVVGALAMGLGVTQIAAIRDGGATTVVGYLLVVPVLQGTLGVYFKRRTDRRLSQTLSPPRSV